MKRVFCYISIIAALALLISLPWTIYSQISPMQMKCVGPTGAALSAPAIVVWVPTTITVSVPTTNGATTSTSKVQMVPSCMILDPSALKIILNAASAATVTLTNPPAVQLPKFVWSEIPVGVTDGVNAVFTLANIPSPATSVQVYVNGLQLATTSYVVSGAAITFNALMQPTAGATIVVSYNY